MLYTYMYTDRAKARTWYIVAEAIDALAARVEMSKWIKDNSDAIPIPEFGDIWLTQTTRDVHAIGLQINMAPNTIVTSIEHIP